MRRTLFLVAAPLALSFCLIPGALGYVRSVTQPQSPTDPPSVPLTRPDASGIQFYINNQLAAGLQSSATGKNVTVLAPGSDPVGAARAALATWNGVGASFAFLPLQSTSTGHVVEGLNVIVVGTSDDLSALGSAVAITATQYAIGAGPDPLNLSGPSVVNGSIVDSDIILNPGVTFTTDGSGSATGATLINGSNTTDLQAVLTHELGHALGASHTGILGATMFQFAALGQRYPSTDDLAFIRAVYPVSGAASPGTIKGTITTGGGSPAAFALLDLIDSAQQITIGGLTAADGTYSLQVPPGSYAVYAEPFNTLVQPGNLYLNSTQAAAAAAFQATVYGGFSSPNTVNVSSGGTTTVSFAVTPGTTTLPFPSIGFGGAGKTGDVKTYSLIQGPQLVPSGGQIDLALAGVGYDSTFTTANFEAFGGGVTIVPGSLRIDPTVTLTAARLPVLRLTLSIATATTASLASIVISKGGSTLALSGALVVTPPVPQVPANGVVNAASYLGSGGSGAVTPGGIYSIFGTVMGPVTGAQNGGFDAYQHLPTSLAGVTVTFDGIPAPLFYVSAAQINLQVPFEIAGRSTTNVVLSYYNSAGAAASVPVFPIQPGFFTDGAGTKAINPDNSRNSAASPVAQGSVLVIYGTGIGVTSA